MQKLLASVALFGATAVLTAGIAQDDRKGDEKNSAVKLEGAYTIVSGEEGGKPIPAERIKGSVVRFTKDRITATDKDRKAFFSATYTLDTSKKPWEIKMKSLEPKEVETTGLVKREGETVTLIYALPNGRPPTDFKTSDNQHLFVLKPMGKEDQKRDKK